MDLERILYRLACLPGFKITATAGGGLIIEADGVTYDGSCVTVGEALTDALIFIQAKRYARDMVKNAKVVL